MRRSTDMFLGLGKNTSPPTLFTPCAQMIVHGCSSDTIFSSSHWAVDQLIKVPFWRLELPGMNFMTPYLMGSGVSLPAIGPQTDVFG